MTWNAPCFLLFLPEPSSTLLSARNKSTISIGSLPSSKATVTMLKQFIETKQDNEEDRDLLLSQLASAS